MIAGVVLVETGHDTPAVEPAVELAEQMSGSDQPRVRLPYTARPSRTARRSNRVILVAPFLLQVPCEERRRPLTCSFERISGLHRVELGGFEPPTSSLRTKRATNCAIAPRTAEE